MVLRLIGAVLLCGGLASAQPVVSGVLNNYSYVPAALPHHGIAQGSIFVIFGTGLANSSTGLQSVPLRTTLEGVSAAVTVGGVTRAVILYYVTPTQVAGILPSATPVGTGTITVTNNGRTSATAPIRVVQSAFGALTLDGSGSGAAAVFDAANQLLGPSNATHPGDVIVLYGTGAGPSAGDETLAQTQTNLSSVPILVEIGGKPATVLYHGRTVFPGLDQINVVVPANAGTGCGVSVAVASGSFVSNFTTIPVAACRTVHYRELWINQTIDLHRGGRTRRSHDADRAAERHRLGWVQPREWQSRTALPLQLFRADVRFLLGDDRADEPLSGPRLSRTGRRHASFDNRPGRQPKRCPAYQFPGSDLVFGRDRQRNGRELSGCRTVHHERTRRAGYWQLQRFHHRGAGARMDESRFA
ncbi:MAG: hypothetical protein B7X34_00615 [Acidobacteriia bacterium 12-62-4]|nr:MAG: hypothetical protein B7X34_00615 [Acidobacteriia bacterium 12-62-4]